MGDWGKRLESRKRLISAVAGGLLALLAVGQPSNAWAQAGAGATGRAEALFVEGAALLDQGDLAGACSKLEAAVELTHRDALGGMLVLAECYERSGKLASAWGLFSEVAGKARASGQADRATEADARYQALTPRLHKVSLELAKDAQALPGLSVLINGAEQPLAVLASPIPVDAGALVVRVSATGRKATEVSFNVPQSPGLSKLVLPVPSEPENTALTQVSEEPSFWGAQRVAGLSVAALGVVTTGVGFVLGGVASSNYGTALEQEHCAGEPLLCDDITAIESARTLGDVATGLVFGGLGVAAVGVVVLLTGEDAPAANASVAKVSFGLRANGAFLEVKTW